MNTRLTEKRNGKSTAKAVFGNAVSAAASAVDVERLKHRVEDAVEDAVHEAERMATHGKHLVTDTIDDTTYYIKRNPWHSVGFVLGASVGVGFLAGWLFGRGGTNCRERPGERAF